MAAPLTLLAHGKVNLSLQVLGRRPDGFHDIRSLLVPLTLADRLSLTPGERGLQLAVPGHPELETEDNLVLRAAEAFQRAFGLPGGSKGLRVVLEKRIPIAAGLGGGSSDAGAMLRALARLSGWRGQRYADLLPLASALGSDVPFFLRERPAVIEGRGERLTGAPPLPALHLLLVKPDFGIAAGDAYRAWSNRSSRDAGSAQVQTGEVWLRAWGRARASNAVGKLLANDLQSGCLALQPGLGGLLARLADLGSDGVLMSGSGSTCFAVFGSAAALGAARRRFPAAPGEQVFTARSLR